VENILLQSKTQKDSRCTEILVTRTLVASRIGASSAASVGNTKPGCADITEQSTLILVESVPHFKL
jgi:hypothetical protein